MKNAVAYFKYLTKIQGIFVSICPLLNTFSLGCAVVQYSVKYVHCKEIFNQVSLFNTDKFLTYVGVPFLILYINRN